MGLWPESWTCCRAPWDTPGCWKGRHKGTPKDAPSKFCVNHGEVNPESASNSWISPYPDWFCGKNYIAHPIIPDWKWKEGDPEMSKCYGHPGYVKWTKDDPIGVWTCCGNDATDGCSPCTEMEHKSPEWPDEEAKKYFYDKPWWPDPHRPLNWEMEIYGWFCGIFRKVEDYSSKDSKEIKEA